MLTTIGAAIVVLGLLILIHELGHFLAAKAVDVAVLRFSIGLGPRTPLTWTWGETEYCVSWVPFGGYVKMAGLEDEGGGAALEGAREEVEVPRERTFDAKPLWARVLIISAGVLMNALFAVVTYAVLSGVYGVATDPSVTVGEVAVDDLPMGAAHLGTLRPGDRLVRINGDSMGGWDDITTALLTTSATPIRIEVAGRADPVLVDVPLRQQEDRLRIVRALRAWHEPVIGDVVPGFPAAAAGLRRGDRVLRADGDTIRAWELLVRAIEGAPGRALTLTVLRAGVVETLSVTPRPTTLASADGGERTVGRVGVGPHLPVERYGVVGSVAAGVRRAGAAGGLVLFTLKGLLTGNLSPRDLGGPILVGQLSGEAVRLGPDAFFGFMALFSMNLAVLNLLPIPVLDGGHLVFLLIEGVRRRPLSIGQRQKATNVGFFILLALMVLAFANDISRVIRGMF